MLQGVDTENAALAKKEGVAFRWLCKDCYYAWRDLQAQCPVCNQPVQPIKCPACDSLAVVRR